MPVGRNATLSRASRPPRTPVVAGPWWRVRGEGWIAVVAGVFVLAQLALVPPGMGLGWDEAVYVSQVSPHVPSAFFSAPRARGVPLLVAPIASWSSSVTLLRIYLAVLSGLGLLLALRAWRGLFPVWVRAVAGGLFASLWVTVFYGPQAMPNYWVAVGALAGTGCFLHAQADSRDRKALWGVGLSAALMAWMRPTDAVWAVLPLLALLVAVRRWRRPALLAALLVGLAAGAAEWVVEAYVSYGGLGRRLSDASAIQGGLGWHIAVADQLRSLGGRALCRPCGGAMPHPAVTLWWFALPVFAALGLMIAVRARRIPATLVPLACATTVAVPYLFMIGYAAPRFLLPAYALLALPVADALVHLVASTGRSRRPVVVLLVALALAGHLAVQYVVLDRTVQRTDAAHEDWERTATALHRLGVSAPCLVTGYENIPIGYYAGCSSASTGGHNANTTVKGIRRTARRMPVAVVVAPGGHRPHYARSWTRDRAGALRVYLAPGVAPEPRP
ncbi:hypothetical protein ABZT03_20690 [Streptomyces sp. NPDC005574]|uniref:hypothetical protein n=1 Tax=Streptomyces sp. NPDC005574 TaxID=3156891 RepID=UPI0033B1D97B